MLCFYKELCRKYLHSLAQFYGGPRVFTLKAIMAMRKKRYTSGVKFIVPELAYPRYGTYSGIREPTSPWVCTMHLILYLYSYQCIYCMYIFVTNGSLRTTITTFVKRYVYIIFPI